MEEKWIKWVPIKGLLNKYYIDSIIDNVDGFKILLSDNDDDNKLEINFKSSIDAYRSTDESYRLLLMDDLNKSHKTPIYGEWTFFKVENSSYIKWLSEQSYGIIDSLALIHFCIIDADSFLDIVTDYEPTITLLEKCSQEK